MKAIVFKVYGNPEKVLELQELDKPMPKDDEVLVKIYATSVNDYDWSLVRGKPVLYRLMFGLLKPKQSRLGMELAGVIEEVGSNINSLSVGDEVFGDISEYGFGSFAEYICINQKAVKKKPKEMSFEEATAIPHASLLALQAMRDKGNIKEGQKILINGAGGGVGTFGLQLAKLLDCEVTGVDSKDKFEMMRSIGFDHVIDYKIDNFTKNGLQYDLILDCKSDQSPLSYLNSLKPNGQYVTIGGKLTSLLKILFWGIIFNPFTSKGLRILSLKPNEGLDYIIELYRQNKIKCILDGPYYLKEIPWVIQYFGKGEHKGKIIIKIV